MNEIKSQKIIKKFKKRVAKEIKTNTENKEFDFVAANDTYWYFRFNIQSGLYTGQVHIIEVKLIYGQSPDLYVYPVHAPKCSFITPIWHPNISDKGTICLDVLKDNWSPTMFTETILNALKVLLEEPDPSSPQNTKAAKMMKEYTSQDYAAFVENYYNYESAPQKIRDLFSS